MAKIQLRITALLFAVVCIFLNGIPVNALDFSLRPKGFITIPMGEGNIAETDGNERYNLGGGGDIGFEVDLSTIWSNPLGLGYTVGIEGGFMIKPLLGDGALNVTFYSAGGTIGLYFFPLSRIYLRVDGAIGVYQSTIEDTNSPLNLFWRGGGEIGFRFTPGFLIAANAGWRQFESDKERPMSSGLYAGLSAQITFQAGRRSNEGISATLDQPEPLYPAFMQTYQSQRIGTVTLRNNENAEIRNVRLFFRAPGYTASEFPCGEVSIIPRGRRVQLPLLADFSPDILRFTDSGRIMGELVVRYRFLGQERESVRAITVATNNRNKVTPDDIYAFASFVSPTSPEALDFARFIAGLERSNRRIGHNTNLQYAMWLLEGLRASNIRLGETYTDDTEVQFPAETLAFRTGSARDLALLFATALEGVGIKSAFIQTENDFLVAISLDADQRAAETLVNGTEKILIVDDSAWLPISLSAYNSGFMAAWARGVAILNAAFTSGSYVDFVIVEDAWTVFPPAPLPELGSGVIRTDNAAALREVNRAMTQYIEQDIQAIIRRIQTQINANPTAALLNRMGILQVRAGRIAEAKASYERAAGMGSVPAMTNRGNLSLSERDYATAERWFRQALQRDSTNAAALRGLERIAGSR
ncbi:MAG: hypothetical protein FWD26_08515 [Treponema sp.]|nr:hypothetical protein [Treponema sp.]